MDDLISRQAILESIERISVKGNVLDDDWIYRFSNDIVAVFDCEMPDDDQPILVTTSHGYVNQDVCYIDDGYSLDSGWDWIDDIKAWMPLPEPYKGESEDTE